MSAECDNFGKGSIQDNNCIDFPLGQTGCRNSGDGSTQNNICTNINDACDNSGSGGSQKNICSNIGSQDQGCWTNGDLSIPKQTSVRTLQVILKEDAKSMVVMAVPTKYRVIPVLARIVLLKTFVL